jgi:membrane protein YqaA with SNARE-associated domain
VGFGAASIYGGLFATAFLAATILPGGSEALLAGLLAMRTGDVVLLLVVATIGNTLGSVANWLMGRGVERFRDRPWFPVGPAAYAAAEQRFRRYGLWSLPFAWVPVVGDPLTIVAGALRTPFWPFLILVGLGKAARYLVLAAGVLHWMG